MFNVQDLGFERVIPTGKGFYAFAKYAGWHYAYNFYITSDGRVEGKTTAGNWLELSSDLGIFVQTKVREFLAKEQGSFAS